MRLAELDDVGLELVDAGCLLGDRLLKFCLGSTEALLRVGQLLSVLGRRLVELGLGGSELVSNLVELARLSKRSLELLCLLGYAAVTGREGAAQGCDGDVVVESLLSAGRKSTSSPCRGLKSL